MSNTVSRTISDETLSRIIQIESAGKPHAKAPTSSATGLGQFLNATWLATVERHRPDWLDGRSRAKVLAMRLDPAASIEMLARFTEDNAASLGAGYTDGDLYLAHFAGVGVARKLLRAPGGDPASKYFSRAAIAANRSILEGKTVGEVRAWAAKKMAAAGRTNWVKKYWPEAAPAQVKAVVAAPVAPETVVQGNEELWHVQRRLKAMMYLPGGLDGRWGGMSAGAISAFLNDRKSAIVPPTSGEDFNTILEPLKAEIAKAEGELFTRPIAPERAEATPAELAPKMPDVQASITAERLGFWGSIGAGLTTALTAVGNFISDNMGWLTTAKEFVVGLPWPAWVGLGVGITALTYFISLKSKQAKNEATKAFQEGART